MEDFILCSTNLEVYLEVSQVSNETFCFMKIVIDF